MADVMPVFAIKARDHFAPLALAHYVEVCEAHGLVHQANEVRRALHEVNLWRAAHPDECKWPDHDHVPAGLPGSGSDLAAPDDQGESDRGSTGSMTDPRVTATINTLRTPLQGEVKR